MLISIPLHEWYNHFYFFSVSKLLVRWRFQDSQRNIGIHSCNKVRQNSQWSVLIERVLNLRVVTALYISNVTEKELRKTNFHVTVTLITVSVLKSVIKCFSQHWGMSYFFILKVVGAGGHLIDEYFFLMSPSKILTVKNHPKMKLQRLRKIRIWAFGSLLHQINSFKGF